ncbi:protein of unknown function [Alcaligenes faecalis subsp. faecalis]|nr:protein of unknown function [Alcaligenes faecalis subsp. faecalis]
MNLCAKKNLNPSLRWIQVFFIRLIRQDKSTGN